MRDTRYTPHTVISIKQLARNCARSREQGFVADDEEYVEGVRCLAAPVRDKDGTIIASIGISAPVDRFPREREPVAAQQVCQTAGELSAVFSSESQI